MNYKEKIELKLEILRDIYSCFHFNFVTMNDNIDMKDLANLINKYENQLEGIKSNENHD